MILSALRAEVAHQLAEDLTDPPIEWRRARRSQGNCECVQVAAYRGRVLIRDSKHPAGPVLGIRPEAWRAFLAAIRAGEAAQTCGGVS